MIFYATSNRRHLMPREMIENEQSTAIVPAEAVDEKVSLSDRFGLWLGFHNCDQETYFRIVEGYAGRYGLAVPRERLRAAAKEWSVTRGARSGGSPGSSSRTWPGSSGCGWTGRSQKADRAARRRQVAQRIDRAASPSQLEMELRPADAAGRADPRDGLAAPYPSARRGPAAPSLWA